MGIQVPLLIIDWKEFRVMSTSYRTCRVTRLSIINLLSTRMVRNMRELFRNSSGKIETVSERNRNSSGVSGKSRGTLKGTGRSRNVLEESRTF